MNRILVSTADVERHHAPSRDHAAVARDAPFWVRRACAARGFWSARSALVRRVEEVAPRLALIICDVWDTHWCATARQQADELAPRINRLAVAVRHAGGVVIHAPSQTKAFYESNAQFLRARETAAPLPAHRPRPSIDLPRHSTCPCDQTCTPPDASAAWPWPWRRQHPLIDIASDDFIACEDGDAVYGIVREKASRPVALCGLHLDQCVLDRPFGAKALWGADIDVVILEDLTEPTHPKDRSVVLDTIARHLPVGSSSDVLPS
jgi:nicotinamidase-related amidase